jgi:hypothetical protein
MSRWRSRNHVADARIVATCDPFVAPSGIHEENSRGTARKRHFLAPGMVFGELTVEALEGIGEKGRVWICRCSCGRAAVRSTQYLNNAVRSGAQPSCAECRRELIEGRREVLRQQLAEGYRKQWVDYGTLWLPSQIEHLATDVRAALEEEFGAIVEEWTPYDCVAAAGYPYSAESPRREAEANEEPSDAPRVTDRGWVPVEIVKRKPIPEDERVALKTLDESPPDYAARCVCGHTYAAHVDYDAKGVCIDRHCSCKAFKRAPLIVGRVNLESLDLRRPFWIDFQSKAHLKDARDALGQRWPNWTYTVAGLRLIVYPVAHGR